MLLRVTDWRIASRLRPGERVLFPHLTILGSKCWQQPSKGPIAERTVYAYTFRLSDNDSWHLDYLGSYHWGWTTGVSVALVATVKRQSQQYSCTSIRHPVEYRPRDTPLFDYGGLQL